MMQRTNDTHGAFHPACASCKHQRKKCGENCILAPFFPWEKSREFQAVHKLFGVSNIQKILKSLEEKDRKRAADSLVWEAFFRQKDPILGLYGEYIKLYDELKLYKNSGHCYQQPTTTMQVLGQDGLMYNSGMTNKGSFGNNIGLHYNHNTTMANSSPYTYGGDVGFTVPLQQNSINGYNSPYYVSGITHCASICKNISTIFSSEKIVNGLKSQH